MFRYFVRKNKNKIILSVILFICSISIAVGIYAQITDAKFFVKSDDVSDQSNFSDLKNNFNSIFTNTINIENSAKISGVYNTDDTIYTAYYIDKSENGKYTLKADIPMFKIETNATKEINTEIYDTFVKKLIDIIKNSSSNTICTISYVGYINNNIASIAIKSVLKEGSTAQRIIMKTYNYDIDNDKILSLADILALKGLDSNKIQKDINNEIKIQFEKSSSINVEGYSIYKRNIYDSMYKIQNTSNYFLGKNGYLYIIYAYGNNHFTSEMDLIIY